MALDWSEREASRCPDCGTPAEDWDEERGGDRDAYRAQLHHCRGDELLGQLVIPAGDTGTRKQLIPNYALPMWGARSVQ